MVAGREVLCKVIGEIIATCFPMDCELDLFDSVSNPVEVHVNGFGSFLFDRVIGDAFSTRVVCLDGSGWLGVSQEL